jgi:hypothetical protein
MHTLSINMQMHINPGSIYNVLLLIKVYRYFY